MGRSEGARSGGEEGEKNNFRTITAFVPFFRTSRWQAPVKLTIADRIRQTDYVEFLQLFKLRSVVCVERFRLRSREARTRSLSKHGGRGEFVGFSSRFRLFSQEAGSKEQTTKDGQRRERGLPKREGAASQSLTRTKRGVVQ